MKSYTPFMCKYCMLARMDAQKSTGKEIQPFLRLASEAESVRRLHLTHLFLFDC